ncbi:MAG: hemolysin III family protein [Proteobacteria bacterium]|nr:hemolysin III family protein [Pseudomonadota bacterium]
MFKNVNLAQIEHHSTSEEIANSIIHGIGTLLAIAALVILVTFASLRGDAWRVVSFSIYGSTLILLYLSSTFYHGFRSIKLKRLFRIFDHATIYLLIAGTYTPFMLVTLRGGLGWSLLGVTWGFAILGIFMTALFIEKFRLISVLSYVGMGWLIVLAIKPLLAALQLGGVIWIASGGIAYTFGIVFYVSKRIPYSHAIWHLFVLGGSICHFFAMLLYVLPS